MSEQPYRFGLAICLAAASAGCESGSDPRSPRAPADAIPETVDVSAAEVEVGVRLGVLRKKLHAESFRISRLPTTVAQYERCVDAGACSSPSSNAPLCQLNDRGVDGATYTVLTSGQAALANTTPLTCAKPEQAAQYCRWVGARLPGAHEWLLAARGTKVARFAWGELPPTCEYHWRTSFLGGEPGTCCKGSCSDLNSSALGQHLVARSPSGADDLLLTAAEMIVPTPKEAVLGCLPGSESCVVSGSVPGAIDFVHSDPDAVASFRCAWEQ